MTYIGKDGGDVFDTASIKRQADLATFAALNLLAKPQTMGGTDYYMGRDHRSSTTAKLIAIGLRLDAFLTLDRRTRVADPETKYEAWKDCRAPGAFAGRMWKISSASGQHGDGRPCSTSISSRRILWRRSRPVRSK